MLLNQFKFLSFCLFVAFSQIMFAQQRPVTDTNYVDNKGRKQGVWKKIDTNAMSYIGQFKDDKPFGQFRYFDKYNRTITVLEYFRDGFATKATHFYPNGKVRATGFYLDKLRDSIWQYYDTTGRILRTEHYLDGMLHGLQEVFDKNGDLVETQEYYRKQRNGLWWQKTEKGTQSTMYKLNKSHGVYEAYYPNEKPSIKGFYEEGLKEGIWYFYHDDGLLDRVMQFEHNQLLKKQVAISVKGRDILLNADSVAYIHTNGKIVEIKMLDGTEYRPVQSFDKLVKSFDTDDFFLATPRFLAAFKLYASLEILPEDEEETAERLKLSAEYDNVNVKKAQKAILKLKIPTPYEIIVNEEVIGLLQNITSSKPVED